MQPILLLPIYFAPSIYAYIKKMPDKNNILLSNTVLGWTIIGWILVVLWVSGRDDSPVLKVIFYDFNFRKFVTIKIAIYVYQLIIFAGVFLCIFLCYELGSSYGQFTHKKYLILLIFSAAVCYIIFASVVRVIFEYMIAIFRIAENTSSIDDTLSTLLVDKNLANNNHGDDNLQTARIEPYISAATDDEGVP